MKTYSGKVNLIGAGTWTAGSSGKGGTQLSALEIGDETFQRIWLSDYLRNYVHVGDDVRMLVYKDFSRHAVVAVEVNNKKYKVSAGDLRPHLIFRTILFCIVFYIVGGLLGALVHMKLIPIILCIVVAYIQFKPLREVKKF